MGKHGFCRFGRALGLCLAMFTLAGREGARADTVTQPLQIYGFGTVWSVAYSPDGLKFAIAANSTVQIMDAQTGQEILFLAGHSDRVASVAFSPNGGKVLTGFVGQDGQTVGRGYGSGDPHLLRPYLVCQLRGLFA